MCSWRNAQAWRQAAGSHRFGLQAGHCHEPEATTAFLQAHTSPVLFAVQLINENDASAVGLAILVLLTPCLCLLKQYCLEHA